MGVDFSVVVPTCRRPRELAESLCSVLSQDGVTIEVWVVDDSPDAEASAVVATLADSRVRYLKNPTPTGGRPALVRNIAWPLATGRFIHFLDDDDRVPAGHYAQVAAEFSKRPDVGMIFGHIDPFGEDKVSVERERIYFSRAAQRAQGCARFGTRLAYSAMQLFKETMLVCSAVIVRKECVAGVKGFNAEVLLCEDADFFGRVARVYGAAFTNRVTLHYRIGESLMHRSNIEPSVALSYRRMQNTYRSRWGTVEFIAMKLFAKTLLRWL